MNDDPVANGMAGSLARPGGNITGIYAMTEELNPKRLALLKEVAPSVRLVGVLLRFDWSNAKHDWQVAGRGSRNLELLALDARSAGDIAATFALASAKNMGGIMTFRNPTVVTHLKLIAELSRKHRLPAVFDAREYVDAGGLMSYGPNIDAIYRRLASYVGQLLGGAPVGQIPIEQPTILELVINKRTADSYRHQASPQPARARRRGHRVTSAVVPHPAAAADATIDQPIRPRGRLFRKYAILFSALVGAALLVSGGVALVFSYIENREAISSLQREKALSAAAAIERFVDEIENQIGWTTQAAYLPGREGLDAAPRRFPAADAPGARGDGSRLRRRARP